MVVLLGFELREGWVGRIDDQIGGEAMVLSVGGAEAQDLARRLPVSVLLADLEPLTSEKLLLCRQIRDLLPGLVTVYLAPSDVREQFLNENLGLPDFWIEPDTNQTELGVTLRAALQQARLVALTTVAAPPPCGRPALAAGDTPRSAELEAMLQLMTALTANKDAGQLMRSYAETAATLVRCANYCLLGRAPGGEALVVEAASGLHPEIIGRGRLSPHDALTTWYRQSSRALLRAELATWADVTTASALAREMDVFRGEVAIPLTIDGRLQGLLLLGEKIVGQAYSHTELETLFALSGVVAVQLLNLQLQSGLRQVGVYLEQSLASIHCGLITLGPNGQIVFCNQAAGHALGREPEQLMGADLRSLPSPLGDLMYAAFHTPEAAVLGREVPLQRTGTRVRVSTAPLPGADGAPAGSVMLVEDVTGPEAERGQALHQETLGVLGTVVGRLAHEVRTPLTAVRTYAQLLGQSNGDPALGQFWEQTVRPELERLERLIEEQVRLVEQPEPQLQLVNLEGVVREAVAELCVRNGQHRAVPEVSVDDALPEIVADPVATREALQYLLRTLQRLGTDPLRIGIASQSTPQGQELAVRLMIRLREGVAPNATLDPVQALQQPDCDLGPAISRQIIEKQGGTLQWQAADQTLQFRVAFPVLVVKRSSPSGVQVHG